MRSRTVRYDRPAEMVEWAEERLRLLFRRDAQVIGLELDGALLAVTVFDTFTPTQCQLHVAAARRIWFTAEYARHVALHAFQTSKLHRVACIVSERNDPAIRFARRMGCQLEGRLREAGPEREDMLSFGLLRRECRWVPPMPLGALANKR